MKFRELRIRLALLRRGDTEQGPPRSEGVVPLPAQRSEARGGGRREATQGEVLVQVKPAAANTMSINLMPMNGTTMPPSP